MRRALDKIASDAEFQPADAYFIFGEFKYETKDAEGNSATLYTDEGLNYCCDCATDLADKARRHVVEATGDDEQAANSAGAKFDDKHRVAFTQLHDEDGSMQCEECHRTLDYALNETGFFSELDHYEGLEFGDRLLPGDAYALARLIDAVDQVQEDDEEDDEDEEDTNDDTEEDLVSELADLDMDDEYDRERAEEIEQELAALRAAGPKVRAPSAADRVTAVAERALALELVPAVPTI
jgi:hypothetical protein